jgi:hypothetical protein
MLHTPSAASNAIKTPETPAPAPPNYKAIAERIERACDGITSTNKALQEAIEKNQKNQPANGGGRYRRTTPRVRSARVRSAVGGAKWPLSGGAAYTVFARTKLNRPTTPLTWINAYMAAATAAGVQAPREALDADLTACAKIPDGGVDVVVLTRSESIHASWMTYMLVAQFIVYLMVAKANNKIGPQTYLMELTKTMSMFMRPENRRRADALVAEQAAAADAASDAAERAAQLRLAKLAPDPDVIDRITTALEPTPWNSEKIDKTTTFQYLTALAVKLEKYVACRKLLLEVADAYSRLKTVQTDALAKWAIQTKPEFVVIKLKELETKLSLYLQSIESATQDCDASKIPKVDEMAVANCKEDLLGAVRIIVRVRKPQMNDGNALTFPRCAAGGANAPGVETKNPPQVNVFFEDAKSISKKRCYGPFFKVITSDQDTSTIFEDMQATFDQVMDGYKVALFGYGYSGSGKTYTLFGLPAMAEVKYQAANAGEAVGGKIVGKTRAIEAKAATERVLGLAQLAILKFLDTKKYTVTVTGIVEYYGVARIPTTENIIKLDEIPIKYDIDKTGNVITIGTTRTSPTSARTPQTFRTSIGRVDDFYAILNALNTVRKQKNRVAATINNPESSRSHLCITLSVNGTDKNGKNGTLVLVDMGGRENPLEIFENTLVTTNFKLLDVSNGKYVAATNTWLTKTPGGVTYSAATPKIITGYNFDTLLRSISTYDPEKPSDFPVASSDGNRVNLWTKKQTWVPDGTVDVTDDYGDVVLENSNATDHNGKRITKMVSKTISLAQKLENTALGVIRTCSEGFYINETINHLTRRLRLANGIPDADENVTRLDPTHLASAEDYNGALRHEIRPPRVRKALKFDEFVSGLLNNEATPTKPSKLVMIACVRSENQPKYVAFNAKTLEFAHEVASTVDTRTPPKVKR